MPDVTLPDPEGSGEDGALPLMRSEGLRGLMAVLGRFLFDAWPVHGSDWDVTYSTVTLIELLNALLADRRADAAELLAELEKAAER